jgi:hypothetical protein
MLNLQNLLITHFVKELQKAYKKTYSIIEPQFGNIVAWTGRLALENIANSDMLYHDVSHTILVTLVGQTILEGKHLCEGGVTPREWMHFMIALLCHDIGYVKGICRADQNGVFATGVNSETIMLPPGGTDAALAPYHVDRSKLFVRERFGGKLLLDVDEDTIVSYLEATRFPPQDAACGKSTKSYPGLVRAADFIGQLGDPDYLRKIPALFYEFAEIGTNVTFGYKNPGDMRKNYARFYWSTVSPYIQEALRYLQVTQEGKQWIANLHSHVFEVEHDEESA